jgi:hypothetical protein
MILGGNEFDSVAETLAILGDPELMRQIRAAEAEDVELYTLDEVAAEMRAAGRLPK